MLGRGGMFSSWSRDVDDSKAKPIADRHYPYVRPLQLEWEERPSGYRALRTDESRFEVICAACGDNDGPAEYQPWAVQELRGPYDAKKTAEKVARSHESTTRAALPRTRGNKEALKFMFPVRIPKNPPGGR